MGISRFTLGMLLDEYRDLSFSGRALTLGVQGVEGDYEAVTALFGNRGRAFSPLPSTAIVYDDETQFGRSIHQSVLFKLLGFSEVDSLDCIDDENPTILWDLNQPIHSDRENAFDLVYDGGTLEHLFSPANGLMNIARLLRVGGRVIHHAPVNGYVNHGYHQFSPVLFRDFYSQNGFDDLKMTLHCQRGNENWTLPFEDADTLPAGDRGDASLVLFSARKVRSSPPRVPVQAVPFGGTLSLRAKRRRLLGLRFAIWGTGSAYRNRHREWLLRNRENLAMIGFIESDPSRHGGELDGYPVIAPEKLREFDFDAVLIASMAKEEILGRLLELNLDRMIEVL